MTEPGHERVVEANKRTLVQIQTYCQGRNLTKIQINNLSRETETTWKTIAVMRDTALRRADTDNLASLTKVYEEIFELYLSVKMDITAVVPSDDEQLNHTAPQVINPHPPTTPNVKLPKVSLPSFKGDLTEWLSFKDLYTSLVHGNPRLNPVEKLQYLKAALQDTPARMLQSFHVTEANYQPAWELLCTRYDDQRAIMSGHMKKLLDAPKCQSSNPSSVRRLYETMDETHRALKVLKAPVEHWDLIFTHLIAEQMDQNLRQLWEQTLKPQAMPTYEEIMLFLERQARILEMGSLPSKGGHPQQIQPVKKPGSGVHLSTTDGHNCDICAGKHFNYACPKLLQLTTAERRTLVRDKRLCGNCLRIGHIAKSCKSLGTCRTCRLKHHTLLHEERTQSHESKTIPEGNSTAIVQKASATHTSAAGSKVDNSHHTINEVSNTCNIPQAMILLSTAEILIEDYQGELIQVKALLDSGSQGNFITADCFQKLRLPKTNDQVCLRGIGGTFLPKNKGTADLTFHSRCSSFKRMTRFSILSQITSYGTNATMISAPFPRRMLADPDWDRVDNVDVLLGAEILADILKSEVRPGNAMEPTAQETELGWILFGACGRSRCTNDVSLHVQVPLDEILQRFWQTETIDNAISEMKPDEQKCEDHFISTHERLADGRYMVRLPFHLETPTLGTNRQTAFKHLTYVERRFQGDPDLKEEYSKFIKEYIELGQMEQVTNVLEKSNAPVYYLPHHAVWKQNGDNKKIRVVFNASSKSENGQSLNDQLMTGPTIQSDIVSIILRFRTHKIGIAADIEKMYRQILVHPEDRPAQRILWRFSQSDPVQEYELKTVTYGMTCAPFLAIRSLQQLAIDEKGNFPVAANCLESDFYVDDLITGADTEEEARKLSSDLWHLLMRGALPLKKWSSNVSEVLCDIPESDRLNDSTLELIAPSTTTLGLKWNTNDDTISIQYQSRQVEKVTKRTILAESARIFDPIGLLAPIIVRIKLLMQELWTVGYSWDATISGELKRKWSLLHEDLIAVSTFQIPRFVHMSPRAKSTLLCGFCDSSEQAMAAVVFVRVIHEDSAITSNLLCSKSKVAPLKKISIPRLELEAALLLAKLLQKVSTTFKFSKENILAWSDSTVTLQWIHAPPYRWKSFVANRVSQIQELLPPNQWFHVRTHENPADVASRGVSTAALMNHNLWWHGPPWLLAQELPKDVPEFRSQSRDQLEERMSVHVTTESPRTYLMEVRNFSTLSRLIRVTAYCFRFIASCKRKDRPATNFLVTSELSLSLNYWLKMCQQDVFNSTIKECSAGKQLSSGNPLISLTPFVHYDELLRVGGRIAQSNLSFDSKHPVILTNKHHLVKLIILDEHRRLCHGGPDLVHSSLRQRYWIIRGHQTIRKLLHDCITCSKHKGLTQTQLMGSLPKDRVVESYPFSTCGIDYAGPFTMRANCKPRSKAVVKAYIVLIICFATKAVHLELVSDGTASTLLLALQRFFGRRGHPQHMHSDQGTVFQATSRQLKREFDKIGEALSMKGITWHLNPPATPHFGGIWESNIKSSKSLLRKVMGQNVLTFEELNTLLIKVEACLNSRPLTPASTSMDDLTPLTPGHFLIGRSPMSIVPIVVTQAPLSITRRWRLQQKLLQAFWDRWHHDYLTTLQQRRKWMKKICNIKVGDMVVVKMPHSAPGSWPLARVIEVFPGADSLVRTVKVRTQNAVLVRSVSQMCVLPMEENLEALLAFKEGSVGK